MQNNIFYLKLPPSDKRWGFIVPKSLKLHYLVTFIISVISGIFVYTQFIASYRYAIFAGYNPKGIIEPYVITYLEGLTEVSDGIVYITDSPLPKEELKKLSHLPILYHYHNRHNEYDWGSYKRGYHWLKIKGYLKKADELIFANDSTYAPITSFKPMFKEMSKHKDIDFWGNSQNTFFNTHLQSYFLVFRKNIINSPKFERFLHSVTKFPDHSLYILKYEITLTPYLESLGYKWKSYIPYEKLSHLPMPDKNSYPLTLIKDYNNQFLKKRTFTDKLIILENTNDLLSYIEKHSPKTYQNIISSNHPRLLYLKIKRGNFAK